MSGDAGEETQQVTETPETPVVEATPISLDVLTTIKETQAVNGLKHNNYERYRRFCSRKLRRMRSKVGLAGKASRGGGYTAREVSVEVMVRKGDVRFVLVPLFEAERAWAYGMQLKYDSETFLENSRLRLHMLRRMAKAEKYAGEFHARCVELGDTRLQLESEGYAAWVEGTNKFLREDWEGALTAYVRAITIFDGLAGSSVQMAQCARFVADIRTNTEYCEYQIRREADGSSATVDDLLEMQANPNSLLNSKLNDLLEETRKEQAQTLSEIEWRGRPIPIRDDDVRVTLVAVRQAEHQLTLARPSVAGIAAGTPATERNERNEAILAAFHAVLLAYSESLTAVQGVVSKLRGRESSQKTKSHLEDAECLEAYVQYELAGLTVKRNEYIVSEMESRLPENVAVSEHESVKLESAVRVARMYQNLVNNLDGVRSVETRWLDDATAGAIVNEVAGRAAAYEAFKTYWVGRAYSEAGSFREALVVFGAFGGRHANAMDAVAQCPGLDRALVTALETLATRAAAARADAHASAVLAAAGENASGELRTVDTPILDRPSVFSASVGPHALSAFPPSFTPIPAQPLFFDLASTYLTFPDLSAKAGQRAPVPAATTTPVAPPAAASSSTPASEPEPEPKKTGWFGLW